VSEALPTPGKHLRKNQKQILAMLRTALLQAGLEWSDETTGTGRGVARGLADGVERVSIEYHFHTMGVDARITAAGRPAIEAPGLFTDTSIILERLRGELEALS